MSSDGKPGDEIEALELEEALRFVHTFWMRMGREADRVEALLMAVLKALIEAGEIGRDDLDRHLARPSKPGPEVAVELGVPTDKYAVESPPDLDCPALLPICQARCCRLAVALSPQDLEERRLRWSYRHPFYIHHEQGTCVHQDSESRRCTVYDHRPAVCRSYDCRGDKRIWLDFDKRILAPLEKVDGDPGMKSPGS
jgi:hypothetical protein